MAIESRAIAENKALWNEARSAEQADFYTLGYEGRPTDLIIDELRRAGVQTLLDIRHNPVSMYRPDLSKKTCNNASRRTLCNIAT
jgi:hypothetical protein